VRQSRQMDSKLHAMYVLIDTCDARCQSAGKDNKSTQQYLIHQSIEVHRYLIQYLLEESRLH